MLYQIRDDVTENTLNMLYYSFEYSILNHGIIVWATATQNQLYETKVRMNNIVRTITWDKKFSHVTHLHKKLDGSLPANPVNDRSNANAVTLKSTFCLPSNQQLFKNI